MLQHSAAGLLHHSHACSCSQAQTLPAVRPRRLVPEAARLRQEFGQGDTPWARQMMQKMGVPLERVRGTTQDLVLAKLVLSFLGALEDMGAGAHMPADSLERLR